MALRIQRFWRVFQPMEVENKRTMSRQCEICGKTPLKSAKLSFSHKQNINRQAPNLQSVKVNVNGTVKRINVCTSCLKAGKVQKVL